MAQPGKTGRRRVKPGTLQPGLTGPAEVAAVVAKPSAGGKKLAKGPKKSGELIIKDAMRVSKAIRSKTLVVGSRNQTRHSRFLMKNILEHLVPNVKKEAKIDCRNDMSELVDLQEMHNCTQGSYWEVIKGQDYYLWLFSGREGPSVKFQVHSIHTIEEMKTAGNALQFSRPVLSFSPEFNDPAHPERTIIAKMLCRFFGCPMYDRRAKPFTDRVYHFSWKGRNVIAFRHYQISPYANNDVNDPDRIELTEIGPRFDMHPIRILDRPMYGTTIWKNSMYLSPVEMRRAEGLKGRTAMLKNASKKNDYELRRVEPEGPNDSEESD